MNLQTAKRLYQYRKESGLSQEELAEKIGVSRQAVSKWERGEASPDTDNLIMLAEVYHITLDELIKGKTEAAEPVPPEASQPDNSPAEDVHISFRNGIHVQDIKKGEHVHVDWKGVHVNTPDSHVHVDRNGVFVQEGGHIFPQNTQPHSKLHRFFNKFPYPILTIMAYLLFGYLGVCGGWSLGWLIFLTIPLYYTLISAIANRNASDFAYPVLIALVYLWLGFHHSLWHPMWILFLTIPLYYFLCEFIKNLSDQHFE